MTVHVRDNMQYCGKIRQLRYYLTEIVPSEPIEPLNRFETERGCQMQVDWVEFRRGKNRLSAFVATLGYSRASYVEFVVDEKLPTLLACHQHAFAYFGGVPKDILYDNMKTIVTQRDAYGEGKHRFQKNFWDFAKHYGFMPRLCRPHRARTKGKVERFNHYLRYSFYVPLASRLKLSGIELDKQTANSEVKRWLNTTANQRIHGTTGKIPAVLLLEEQLVFQILPPPYEGQAVDAVIDETPVSIEIFPVMHQHPLSTYDALLH